MPEYATLRLIWWVILGMILLGFSLTDGFDLGIASLGTMLTKQDSQRRIMFNTIGPYWEGNQVWLIVAGAGSLAAWPYLYAVSFSGLYFAMFIALFGLILRPVSFKYRSKKTSVSWRRGWDFLMMLSGVIPAFMLGVIVGNLLDGLPFHLTFEMRAHYLGGFLDLFKPFTLLCGMISLLMFQMHGCHFLAIKVEPGELRRTACRYGRLAGWLAVVLFVLGGVWMIYKNGYVITSQINHNGPSNPLGKQVTIQLGGWLHNYAKYPRLWVVPAFGVIGGLLAGLLIGIRSGKLGFLFSSLSIIGIVSTFGVSMFPFLLPSTISPGSSLTVWDSSSSYFTLFLMLLVVIIFLPIILSYTSWVYYVLRGKVTEQAIQDNEQAY